jgi:hypothetical protein
MSSLTYTSIIVLDPTNPVEITNFLASNPGAQILQTGVYGNAFVLGYIISNPTNVLKTNSLVTTATTADQVILTYTVTAGKTFYMTYLGVSTKFTVFLNNTDVGKTSLESPAGTKLITDQYLSNAYRMQPLVFTPPIPFAAGTVIRVVCTPSVATSITWVANFGGYEQ